MSCNPFAISLQDEEEHRQVNTLSLFLSVRTHNKGNKPEKPINHYSSVCQTAQEATNTSVSIVYHLKKSWQPITFLGLFLSIKQNLPGGGGIREGK
jgi:hypothetical protein